MAKEWYLEHCKLVSKVFSAEGSVDRAVVDTSGSAKGRSLLLNSNGCCKEMTLAKVRKMT